MSIGASGFEKCSDQRLYCDLGGLTRGRTGFLVLIKILNKALDSPVVEAYRYRSVGLLQFSVFAAELHIGVLFQICSTRIWNHGSETVHIDNIGSILLLIQSARV